MAAAARSMAGLPAARLLSCDAVSLATRGLSSSAGPLSSLEPLPPPVKKGRGACDAAIGECETVLRRNVGGRWRDGDAGRWHRQALLQIRRRGAPGNKVGGAAGQVRPIRPHLSAVSPASDRLPRARRPLLTPGKRPLLLPSRALAMGVAAEWEYQDAASIRPFTMPLMRLSAISLDEIPGPRARAEVTASMLRYFSTDTACCRAPPATDAISRDGRGLDALQAAALDPVVSWLGSELGPGMTPHTGHGLTGVDQPHGVTSALSARLRTAGDWELAALDSLTATCRSLVLAIAAAAGRLSPEAALAASRVEEVYQVAQWGSVDGGHDVDAADQCARIAAAVAFLRLLGARTVAGIAVRG